MYPHVCTHPTALPPSSVSVSGLSFAPGDLFTSVATCHAIKKWRKSLFVSFRSLGIAISVNRKNNVSYRPFPLKGGAWLASFTARWAAIIGVKSCWLRVFADLRAADGTGNAEESRERTIRLQWHVNANSSTPRIRNRIKQISADKSLVRHQGKSSVKEIWTLSSYDQVSKFWDWVDSDAATLIWQSSLRIEFLL